MTNDYRLPTFFVCFGIKLYFCGEFKNEKYMEAVRTIVNADVLAPIIDLPWRSNMKVEVFIVPFKEKRAVRGKSMKGCLKEYANPALWDEEGSAWENHIAEKYAIT